MKKSFIALGIAGALVFTGCAGKKHKIEDVPVTVQPHENPAEQLDQLTAEFEKAKTADLPLLAPTWFAQAQDSYKEALHLRNESKDTEELYRKIAEARIELRHANEVAVTSQKVLATALSARKEAVTAVQTASKNGAMDLKKMREDLADADKDFRGIAEEVEKDDLDDAREGQPAVVREYLKVHGQALAKANLDSARRTIEEAKRLGAEDYAPTSLEFAEGTLGRAQEFVAKNPQLKDEVKRVSQEANFYAQRTLKLTQEAKALAGGNPEALAMKMQEKLNAEAQQTEAARLEAEHNAAVAGKFKGAHDREALVAEIRKHFKSEEAEVIQKGDLVVIRLRNLNFPVGQAVLKGSDFATLKKVAEAAALMEGAAVTVEGHTDSTGNKASNLELSQKRAEAVRDFLVTSGVEEGQVQAVGKGFDEPLVSNKTKKDRAINRRVDVVLEPSGEAVARKQAE